MGYAGAIAQRGFIVQSIISIITCLERDDWDEMKIEPETNMDRVDLMLYKNKSILSAIQVKSSTRSFQKSTVEKWLYNLKSDALEATDVCLVLVGDSFSPSCANYIENNPEIKTVSLENLNEIYKESLDKYIRKNDIGEDVRYDVELISEILLAEIQKSIFAENTVNRADFESALMKAMPFPIIPLCLTPIPAINQTVGLIGRDDTVKRVKNLLEKNNCTALVTGLGGIGKTAIMQYVCNELKNEGYYVAWINWENSLKDGLLLLRDALGVPKEQNADEAFALIISIITSRLAGKLYLFIDNLTRKLDEDEFRILNSLSCHVMVTSRIRHDNFENVAIDVLNKNDALDLFYSYYLEDKIDKTRRYEDAAWDIITSVQSHTLLVELLAKAACKTDDTLDAFNKKLHAASFFDVFKGKISTEHDDKNLTIEESVRKLYYLLGLTKGHRHIMELFTIFTPEKEIYYKVAEWAELDMDAMDELVELGWLERGGLENGYQIHQIVKDSLSKQAGVVRLKDYGNLLDKAIDTNSYLSVTETYEFVKERIVLTEDIAELLWKGYQSNSEKDKKWISNAGTLLNNIAGVYNEQGDYGKALEYYGKALVIREQELGTEHPDTATTYNNMAVIYSNQGDYGKALEYYGKALSIRERELGKEHPDTATTYSNMAVIYSNQGDYGKALEYYGKALSIRERELGKEHPDTATTYSNMAVTYQMQGNYGKALEYCWKALSIQERVLGTEHPDTATTYSNMAVTYQMQGEYEKALEYCSKALAIQERVLGTEHPDTATTYSNLADMYNKQGESEKAREYCRKALAIQERILGVEYPNAAKTRGILQEIISKDDNRAKIVKILEDFFHNNGDSYPSFAILRQLVEKENLNIVKDYPHSGINDIFRFAEAHNTEFQHSEIQELLELLWKLYLVDSERIKKEIVQIVPSTYHVTDKNAQTIEKSELSENKVPTTQDKGTSSPHKAKWKDLEKATKLVLKDFENWWKGENDRKGLTFSIEKHTDIQNSGLQFGYDVGLNTKIGELKYRLRFECKYYSDNISDCNQDKISDLTVSHYAYNLLEYYMECESDVNNRWVLICPFGRLQNNFPERLFERWNKNHNYIKIYALMENGPSLTCKDFLSVNEQAYWLVYKSTYDGKYTKDDVFKYLYEKIVGPDSVKESMLKRLSHYPFWGDYRGNSVLLSVPNRKNKIALEQILDFLQRKKKNNDNERKKTLFVIGEYGTGKSWLCYQAIEQIVCHPSYYRLMPFFLRLKVLSQKQDLEDETQYEFIINNALKEKDYEMYDKWAEECVRENLLPVFFLDGLDEVFSGLSATKKKIVFLSSVIDELKEWYERYETERECQSHTEPLFIITSRESDFELGIKSEDFHQQMEQAEIIELDICSAEETQKKWNKLVTDNQKDGSWFLQLEQHSAFLNIIRRPVFFSLCANATKKGEFKRKVASALLNEADVLDLLFEKDLENYTRIEDIKKEDLRKEIYRCAVKCSVEKKSQVIYEGKSINEVIHVGMVKIRKDPEIDGTCWVSFEHNIVREYLTARFLCQCLIDSTEDEINNPMTASFVKTLQDLSLTPEAIKLLLLCIEKNSHRNRGDYYRNIIKKWLCDDKVKNSQSRLPSRLLEILLQPGYTLSGKCEERLDLSGLHANDICLWNCTMRHVDLSYAVLRNWQMINMELDDVDLRGADMKGLRIAPDKPISGFCYWKEAREWHVAALHKNGQLMKYSFTENSWEHYSAEVLSKNKANSGIFRFGNEILLHSGKRLYDEENNELYQFRNSNELRQIITSSGFCGVITKRGDECQVVIFQGDFIPIAYTLNKTDPNLVCITEKGQVLYVQDGSMNLIGQNGESRRLFEWESSYECFALRIEPTGGICIYIKCDEKLIRLELDEQLYVKKSSHKELLIQGESEIMRELRVLNENALAAIGETDLFILSLGKNQVREEVKCKRIKTDILIKNLLLEDEGGINRVQDARAYELLYTSIYRNQ